jgi:hypothetical protein
VFAAAAAQAANSPATARLSSTNVALDKPAFSAPPLPRDPNDIL